MQESWQTVFASKQKCLFSSFVYYETGTHNVFHYQNTGSAPEEVMAVFFHLDGRRVEEVPSEMRVLLPGHSLMWSASDLLRRAGYERFRGSVLCIGRPARDDASADLSQQDFVCLWSSGPGRPACHIGLGALKDINLTGKKEKQSYYMFCPTVISTETRQTWITFFNHSSEPGYADQVSVRPVLQNLMGERLEGAELTVGPFGTFLMDVDEVFGDAGRHLLAKTSGRGAVTVLHRGHTFATLFFHLDRRTHEIVSGTHTSPAIGITHPYGVTRPLLNRLAEKTPLLYALYQLKHFRSSTWFENFYPQRPLILGSWWAYAKQSRWVLNITYVTRLLYFMVRRGFNISIMPVTDETKHHEHVIQHNLWGNLNIFHFCRGRLEHLMYLLELVPARLTGRTLCIGPRNEGEILLFRRHGFTQVVGIDLFTYSPAILLMDAHHMTFEDGTFDTINCGWVFKYCDDLPQVIREIIRVAKDGALVACSFTVPRLTDYGLAEGSRLEQGIGEILALFGGHVQHIFWRDDEAGKPGDKRHLVFRITKSAASSGQTSFV